MLGQVALKAGQHEVVGRVGAAPADRDGVVGGRLQGAVLLHLPTAPVTPVSLLHPEPLDVLRRMPPWQRLQASLSLAVELPQPLWVFDCPLPVSLASLGQPRPSTVLPPKLL